MPYKDIKQKRKHDKKYSKRYYTENKEEIKKYYRKYYQGNKEKLRPKSKQYYQENKGISKRYKKRNKEKIREYQKEYYKNNKNKFNKKEYQKEYYQRPEVKERIKEDYHKNKEKIKRRTNKYTKNKYKKNRDFNIMRKLKWGVWNALEYYTKTGKIMTSKKYGINYKAIIEYLKPIPEDYLTSKNKYDIHHIKPLFTFNFIHKDGSTNLKEVQEAWKPENLIIITKEKHKEIHREFNKIELK